MSLTETMGSQFFSLPYDREGYGSLERLIDRDWDGTERDETGSAAANESTDVRWDRSTEAERTRGLHNRVEDRTSQDRNIVLNNESRTNSQRDENLIDFDNSNDFQSCDRLDSNDVDFIDFDSKSKKGSLRKSQFNSVDNYVGTERNSDLHRRAVDLRNRRNVNDATKESTGQLEEVKFRQYFAPCYDCDDTCSRSLPAALEDYRDRSQCGGNGYGSLPGGDDMSNTDQTLTYCVHGKPGAGCCATLLNQPTAPAINISVEEHCHIKERDTGINKKARRQIIIVSTLCLFFMIAEAVGGYLSGSLAIATDAAHLLTDFAGFMISLFALYVAARKPSKFMPFGWHRAEVIGAMLSVLTIWLVTGILVYLAVQRLINKDFEIDATVMLITSAIGVVVNIVMALTLHQHSHAHTACSHSGGSSSSVHNERSPEKQNINVRAAFIHIIGDLLQSVGVFIAATIIYYKPEYSMVDPICTFLFSVLVLLTTFNIMKDALLVLMEGIPRDVDYNDVLSTLLAIDGVIRVHNLRIWALSLDKTALSAHLAIAPSANCTEILKSASKEIHKKYNFFEMTLQIEYFQQNMETCAQCQVP